MDKNSHTSSPAPPIPRPDAIAQAKGSRLPLTTPEVPEGNGLPDFIALAQRAITYWGLIAVVMVIGAVVTGQVVKRRKTSYRSEVVLTYKLGIEGNPSA